MEDELHHLFDLNILSAADPRVRQYPRPSVEVPKKDGRFPICMDYRRLKQQTGQDQFPLPRIEIFTVLQKANWFVSRELLMGQHQIPVRGEDRPKTAFITQNGLFVFNVMQLGL